jgi:Uma2 family endonuclease
MDGRNDMKPTPAKLTYDDFVNFPDDRQRHELIDGEHYVTPSPAIIHQRLVGRIHIAISNWLQAHPKGEVFLSPLDVVLSRHDVVEPDLLVVLSDQSDIITTLHVRGTPALVIEVLSPGTRKRDIGLKRRLYERVGVREYWLVDPDHRRVTVCRRADDGLAADAPLREGDMIVSSVMDGFSLGLDALFHRLGD